MRPAKSRFIVIGILFIVLSITSYTLRPHKINAGTFQNASVTISNSRAGATSVTYDFAVTTTVTTAIKQIDIYFCTTPTGTCTAPNGLNSGTPTLASDNVAGTGRTTSKIGALDNTIRVVITTPAAQATQAVTLQFTGLTNPNTSTSYYARIISYSDTGTTEIDNAQMGMYTLASDTMTVTANLGPTFTVTVTDVTTGSVNGEAITITGGTSASTIPFGVLTIGTPVIAAHDVAVITNANNGYQITVKSTDPPLADGANNIDAFSGTNASPATWSEPAGSTKNDNTGYVGYTTNDASLGSGTTDRFTSGGGNKWAGLTTTAAQVAYNDTAVTDAQTTRIGWQLEVNGLQPPGAYTGTMTMVVTPTY